MPGIRAASPLKGPVKIVASISFSIVFFFTASQVPLQSFVGLIFRNNIMVRLFLVVAGVEETLGDPGNLKIQMDN